jgi:outer membrane protein TolC
VAGCALTRVDPETPELMLPQALPAQPAAGGDAVSPTASLPDPWWQIFADPELDRMIDEGLARNTDVAVAAARVAQARARRRSWVRIACRRSTSPRVRAGRAKA